MRAFPFGALGSPVYQEPTTINNPSMLRTRLSPLFLLLAFVSATACSKVDTTEHCIRTRYGSVVDENVSPGLTGTFTTDLTCFTLTDQNFPSDPGSKETMEAQTKDPITVQGDVAIVYAFDPATIPAVFRAKRSQSAVEVEIQNAIREGYRSALAGWTVTDIFSERRASLADSVRAHIQKKLGNRAVIKNVFVRAITVPKEIEDARVSAAKQEQILDQARKQEQIAKANANSAIAQAQGAAESKRLEAQSYAANPKLLDLEIAKALAGLCGQSTTCVIGASPNALLGLSK